MRNGKKEKILFIAVIIAALILGGLWLSSGRDGTEHNYQSPYGSSYVTSDISGATGVYDTEGVSGKPAASDATDDLNITDAETDSVTGTVSADDKEAEAWIDGLVADITISADTVSQDDFGQYADNYLTIDAGGISYEGYRIAGDKNYGATFRISTPEETMPCDVLDGSFSNITPISGIRAFTVEYKSGNDVILYYGNDSNDLSQKYVLPASDEYVQRSVLLESSVSFFRLTATMGDVHVVELNIYCEGSSPDETSEHLTEGLRYIPETDYDPYEGETLEIPVVQLESDGAYYVTEWKSYTYHSFDYCKEKISSGKNDPEDFALTDPVDVANYFILFNRIPANYGKKDGDDDLWEKTEYSDEVPSGDAVLKVFGGEYARYARPFSRTDGYVRAVDWDPYKNTGKPLYIEFDFDIDGTYSLSRRGVGRVVGWTEGFNCYGDGINAATVTTDHYYTFGEYSNCGFFNAYFDATSEGRTGLSFAQSYEIAEEDLDMEIAA